MFNLRDQFANYRTRLEPDRQKTAGVREIAPHIHAAEVVYVISYRDALTIDTDLAMRLLKQAVVELHGLAALHPLRKIGDWHRARDAKSLCHRTRD